MLTLNITVSFGNLHFHLNLLLHSSETQQSSKCLECTWFSMTCTIYLIFMLKKVLQDIHKNSPFSGYVDALQKGKLPTF